MGQLSLIEMDRICSKCGETKSVEQYPFRSGSHYSATTRHRWCFGCIAEYQAGYRRENQKELRKKKQVFQKSARVDGLKAMGARCNCCGVEEDVFLTLDHVDGREEGDVARGPKAWVRARARNWVGYQVLCFNCNYAKFALGVCPHMEIGGGANEDAN